MISTRQITTRFTLIILLGLPATVFSQSSEPLVFVADVFSTAKKKKTIVVGAESPTPPGLPDHSAISGDSALIKQHDDLSGEVSKVSVMPSETAISTITAKKADNIIPTFSTNLETPPPFTGTESSRAAFEPPWIQDSFTEHQITVEVPPIIEAAKSSFTMIESPFNKTEQTVRPVEIASTAHQADQSDTPQENSQLEDDLSSPVARVIEEQMEEPGVIDGSKPDEAEGKSDPMTDTTTEGEPAMISMQMPAENDTDINDTNVGTTGEETTTTAESDAENITNESENIPDTLRAQTDQNMKEQDTEMILPPDPIPVVDMMLSGTKRLEFISLNHIFFDHNSSKLTAREKLKLDDIAEYISKTDTVSRLLIEGHANSIAGHEYNFHLSDKRATAVKKYLIQQGINKDLMYLKGWGESFPVDQNWTRAGSQRNRHVELYLIQHRPQEKQEKTEVSPTQESSV